MVYNFVWGGAWSGFMRREWTEAMEATRRPMPFAPEVWFLMVVLSFPIGVGIVIYGAQARSAAKASAYSALTLWALMTAGMTGWGWMDAVPSRVLVLDATVNLAALLAAALAAAWRLKSSPPLANFIAS